MTETETPQAQSANPPVQQPLPNATAVLVLGILSILFGCCFSVVGVIMGIIALVLASKDMKLYRQNPDLYTNSSFSNLNAGRITAIIGLVIGVVVLIYTIVVFSSGEFFDQYKEMLEEVQNQQA